MTRTKKLRFRAGIPAVNIKIRPSHPGKFLAEEMEFRGLNANSLAVRLGVPRNRLAAIMEGERAITPDTALRIEACLGIKAYMLLGLQADYDLATAERDLAPKIRREVKPMPLAQSAHA